MQCSCMMRLAWCAMLVCDELVMCVCDMCNVCRWSVLVSMREDRCLQCNARVCND